MTLEEKRLVMAESLKLLATHEPFIQFLGAMDQMREFAIADACRPDGVDNAMKIAAALGEIRAYNDIRALVAEYKTEND